MCNTGHDRVCFLTDLSAVLSQCGPGEFLFLGGDFNCTEDDRLDRNHIEPLMLVMKQLVETHSLSDVWREMHGQNRQYTWVQSRENVISMARLDRFYCFKHHFSVLKGCWILPVGFSDHCMVSCNVFIANLKHRSAYWHFTTALLLDVHFKESFIFFWKVFRTRKEDFISLKQWWDRGKAEIKQFCQEYALNVSRDITKSMRDLEIEIVTTGNRGCIEALTKKPYWLTCWVLRHRGRWSGLVFSVLLRWTHLQSSFLA